MRSWLKRLRKVTIPVAGRAFVEGVCTPLTSLDTRIGVRFAMPIVVANQRKSVFRK